MEHVKQFCQQSANSDISDRYHSLVGNEIGTDSFLVRHASIITANGNTERFDFRIDSHDDHVTEGMFFD